MKAYKLVIQILVLVLITSCGDEQVYFPQANYLTGANIKFVHAGTDVSPVTFYVNNGPISNSISYGNTFPVTDYALRSPGTLSLGAIIPATESTPEAIVSTGSVNGVEGSHYTVALIGTSPDYEIATLTDDLTPAKLDGRKAYVRLANFIGGNSNGIKLEMTPTGGVMFQLATNIQYKNGSAFIEVEPGLYSSIVVKDAVDGTSFGTAAANIRNLAPNKIYTFFGRGKVGVSTALSRMVNR